VRGVDWFPRPVSIGRDIIREVLGLTQEELWKVDLMKIQSLKADRIKSPGRRKLRTGRSRGAFSEAVRAKVVKID